MGSALCGGGEVWPPLPPGLQEAYDRWVADGRPGADDVTMTEPETEKEEG